MAERESKPWNSWENLILVCLVQRHGLEESWKTISIELKSRVHQNSDRSSPPEFFTPQECMQRFSILHERFLATRETNDNGGFEKTIQAMKDEYIKIRKETLKHELEMHEMNIKLQKQKLERLKRGEEVDGDLRTRAEKVVVNENEDGDDEPSFKMDGGDESGRIDKINELNPVGVGVGGYNLSSSKTKMNKTMMYEVLEKLQMSRSSKNLHHKLHTQKMTESYRKTIRQHMELDHIQLMIYLEEYTNSFHLFFRDLYLFYNNVIVFFEKGSQEHIVALQLRKVVREEMEKVISNPVPEEDVEEEIQPYLVVMGLPASSTALAKSRRKPRSVHINAS